MEVICFEDRAFFAMIDKLEAYIDSKRPKPSQGDKWVSGEEAMKMLRITSKTTLQKFRDEGKIRYSQPEKKSSYTMPTASAILLKILPTKPFNNGRRTRPIAGIHQRL